MYKKQKQNADKLSIQHKDDLSYCIINTKKVIFSLKLERLYNTIQKISLTYQLLTSLLKHFRNKSIN